MPWISRIDKTELRNWSAESSPDADSGQAEK